MPTYNTLYEEEVSPRKKQLIERGYNTKNMDGDRYLYIYDEDAFRVRESEGKISREDFDIVRHVDTDKGNRVTDVFEIDHLNSQAIENAGYATQKPLALAKRIIEASSNPGDLVVDVFAGCATTLVAAEVTGRRWLGCDWAYRAWTMNKRRFVSIPDGYGGPMRLTGTTEATLRALGLEGAQIPPLESFTIGPPDLEGLPTYSIAGVELAVARAKRRDPTWTGRYSKDEAKREMLDEWGAICWGCGWEPRMPDGVTPNEFYLQVDHSLARSKGGEDELYNLSLLCPECNARKRDREMEIVELRQENDRRDALHMSIATLNKRVPLARIRKWAQGKMDERPRLGTATTALS